ncbi:MAG: cysteine desulfurase [Polyangiaceae bacterium]|nr:cysteine desulfurase [Polyangiaceae bacterium]
MGSSIYLDHNATTALDPIVRTEMTPWLDAKFGNPSSLHAFGQEARRAVDAARARVARLVGAEPEEIVLTSGGTEANNLAILGVAEGSRPTRRRVVTTAIEHQSVLGPCGFRAHGGGALTVLPVDRDGRLDPAEALASLRNDTLLASVMLANNDVGTEQPVGALASRARELGIPLHTDAVQAVGKVPVDVRALGVDLLSFSAHKLHGPSGAGALYVRRGVALAPRAFGGHQERGLRPGTENVAAIVGFGKACDLAAERLERDATHLARLRAGFEAALLATVPGAVVNGDGAPRLPNTSNVSFDGVDGQLLVINLDLLGLAVSTGAACSSADREPSHVLLAMGRTPLEARASMRCSFGRGNTDDDVSQSVERIARAVSMLREVHQ